MLHFLKAFLDIVLWRRGPQDLPASPVLLWLTGAGYVAVSVLQLVTLDDLLQPLERAARRAVVAACSPEVWPDPRTSRPIDTPGR